MDLRNATYVFITLSPIDKTWHTKESSHLLFLPGEVTPHPRWHHPRMMPKGVSWEGRGSGRKRDGWWGKFWGWGGRAEKRWWRKWMVERKWWEQDGIDGIVNCVYSFSCIESFYLRISMKIVCSKSLFLVIKVEIFLELSLHVWIHRANVRRGTKRYRRRKEQE